MYVCVCVCMYVYVCMYVCMYVFMCMYMYVCVCMYVCMCVYLKSVLRHKVLILCTYDCHTDLREQGCEGPWLLLEAKRDQQAKLLGNTDL